MWWTTDIELTHKGRRNIGRCGRHDNSVERRLFRPPKIAISDASCDGPIAQTLQSFGGLFAEFLDNLDRKHLDPEFGEHSRLVS